jgi:hypothetical protein
LFVKKKITAFVRAFFSFASKPPYRAELSHQNRMRIALSPWRSGGGLQIANCVGKTIKTGCFWNK